MCIRDRFSAESLRVHQSEGGPVMHAMVSIGNSFVMLNDEFPEHGVTAPSPEGSGVTLHLFVEDVDAAFRQAVDAGANTIMPPDDMFWGDRYAIVKDPFGHKWSIATHVEDVPEDEMNERAKQAFSPEC